MTDVLVHAPVATLSGEGNPLEVPSPEELYRITYAALQDERRKNVQLTDFARQTASLCLALTRLLIDAGRASETGVVTIPRSLHEEMLGASIQTGEKSDGDFFVRIAERGRQRIHVAQ